VPGLQTTVNFWRVDIKNYITQPDLQDLIDYPNLFPNAVTRAPPTAQDQANGYLGVITQIDQRYTNYGDYKVAGADLDVRYTLKTAMGDITPSVALTETYKFLVQLAPSVPITDHVDKASSGDWAPRWKGNLGLGWKKTAYAANVTGRYVGRYFEDFNNIQNGHRLGNFWIVDVNVRYALGDGLFRDNKWLKNSYVSAGGVNILNRLPQATASPGIPFDPSQDLRGRYLYTSVGLSW